MIYIKTVTFTDRVGYLTGPLEAWVEVVWGDPLSRKHCRTMDYRSEIKSLADSGFNNAAEFVITAPKSVSLASEVLGDSRVRAAFLKEAQVLGQDLLQKAPLAQELEVPSGNMKARFVMFGHRTTNPREGPPQPHLNLHLLVFAGILNGTPHPLRDLDLRPVHARRKAFHARFLCGLAHRLKKLGYGVVQTPAGFELAGIAPPLLKDFFVSKAVPPRSPGRRRRWQAKDIEDLWKTKLGGRGLDLVAGPAAQSLTAAPHHEEPARLFEALDAVFADDIYVPLPAVLTALFQSSTGVCRPEVALRWLAAHSIGRNEPVRQETLYRTLVVERNLSLCRCQDYDSLRELQNFSRGLRSDANPWISLAKVGARPCNWRLVDNLLLWRQPVMGLMVGQGLAADHCRAEIRGLIESRQGVGVFLADKSKQSNLRDSPLHIWGRWNDLVTLVTKGKFAPEVIWILDADQVPQRSILDVSLSLLKVGKKLIFDGSGDRALGRVAILATALGGRMLRREQVIPQARVARERKLVAAGGIEFRSIPAGQVESQYQSVFASDPQTVLVCADESEARWYAQRIRSRLFDAAVARGGGVYHMLQLHDVGWTDQQKQDPQNFHPGLWVHFRRRLKTFRPTEKLRVLGRRDGQVIVEKWGSLEAVLPLQYPKDLEVCEGKFEAVALGELLRVARYHKTVDNTRFEEGELVLVSSGLQRRIRPPKCYHGQQPLHTTGDKWLPLDFGFWEQGYCTTPDRPPLKVRHVIVLEHALPAFAPALWLPRIKAGGSVIGLGVSQKRLLAQLGLQPAPGSWPRRKRRLLANVPGLVKPIPPSITTRLANRLPRLRLPQNWQEQQPGKLPVTPQGVAGSTPKIHPTEIPPAAVKQPTPAPAFNRDITRWKDMA